MERHFGLIGYPLSHSFSARFFEEKFNREKIMDCNYQNFPLKNITELPHLVEKHFNLYGLNVTIPYKESVLSYLETLSETAKEIGAVNTIKIERTNHKVSMHGYNTDAFGFYKTLTENKIKTPEHALILGTGGASKAVEWVLNKSGCRVWLATRSPQASNHFSYDQLKKSGLSDFGLIINTTPLGMWPNSASFPDIPYETAGQEHTFIDLIYNPETTVFIKKAMDLGAKAINGLLMLQQQAEKSWMIWNGKSDDLVG